APAVLLGHTINASAVARAAAAVAASLATDILLVPAGFAEDEARLNLEDTLTCGCIIARGGLEPANDAALAALYAYQHVGPKALAEHFLQGSHGRHLVSLGREADIRFLSQVDITDLVPVRERVGELQGVRYVEFAQSRELFA
ncbi:MAG: 2-phosphosulfolactate phosphatase, partial [Armatimonadetes bacterium]|nr:2-phosphosulfolactate phosphatase [Armatimonadota bacterium]